MSATIRPSQYLGELLLAAGQITREQLNSALRLQKQSGLRLGEVLIGMGAVAESDVARSLAQQMRLPFLPDHEVQCDFHLAGLVPPRVMRLKRALPIAERLGRLVVAMADPLDVFTQDEIKALTGKPVDVVVATPTALERCLVQFERLLALQRQGEIPGPELTLGAPLTGSDLDDAPIVQLVNDLIDRALRERASDIHIEPAEDGFRVRLRIDGFLREIMRQGGAHQAAVAARIKVMAALDIAERRAPQDGRVELRDRGRNVDLRVSTLPTIYGEKVVIRIFDKSRAVQPLPDLGMAPDVLARYIEAVSRPHGMVLVTGPTGSGKTTTLTSTLAYINQSDSNIITIEDPVEYQLPGINHCQVNQRAGLTFAGGLRSILRQDPDVIMVGEVRDSETAELAVRSALTGHLVLSTLHTGTATGALTRLLDMGIEPYLIASSIHAVLAQRLVRQLCLHCRRPTCLEAAVLADLGITAPPGGIDAFSAVGCSRCQSTGYQGRLPVFELLAVTPPVRERVLRRAPEGEMAALALSQGMRPLLTDGMEKVRRGLTSLEEVLRVARQQDA